MVKTATRRKRNQGGQAVVLTILSVSIFMFAGMGLAIDASQLYAQRQMAQGVADAAAQAGIVTIFNGSTAIGTSAYYCTSANTTSPCTYVQKNGYTAGTCTALSDATPGSDCIKVDPNPGVPVSSLDPVTPNELQVTVTRAVSMTLMKLAGISSLNVTARATAAILDVMAPVPILVTHPWKSGSFVLGGTGSGAKITICGGPARSIQVNSSSSTSITWTGNPTVDLSKAGPNDPGNCTTGTGADLGDFGGPSSASALLSPMGTTEHYVQPADPVLDPLANVSAPTQPAAAASPTALANGANGCPASPAKACQLYYPGTYTSDISVTGQTAVFSPGIYYMNGTNFSTGANGYMTMATGLTDTTTGTGWTGNMLVYMTGPTTTSIGSGKSACTPTNPAAQTGAISVGANGSVSLTGSPTNSSYKGMLFFVDRSAVSQSHTLDGGGGLVLVGTVYTTDTVSQMGLTSASTCGQYQTLTMQGNAGSSTLIAGEIITSKLSLQGTPGIVMNLNPNAQLVVRQIALVNGE